LTEDDDDLEVWYAVTLIPWDSIDKVMIPDSGVPRCSETVAKASSNPKGEGAAAMASDRSFGVLRH
jgi:hypothetical protein